MTIMPICVRTSWYKCVCNHYTNDVRGIPAGLDPHSACLDNDRCDPGTLQPTSPLSDCQALLLALRGRESIDTYPIRCTRVTMWLDPIRKKRGQGG